MSGEKKRSASSDMEYQYTDENNQEPSVESAKKSTPSLRTIRDKLLERLPKKKKSRLILILLVAIYIVYKFLNSSGPTPRPSVTTSEKIISQPLTKPAVEVAPVKTVVLKPVKPSVSTEPTKSLNYSATTGEQESQMKELQASLDQMNQSITTLESSLLNLTGSVIGLSNKVSALERMRQEEKIAARRNPLPVYHLQSLVPERAWLQSPQGILITVKVGDSVPGYGQIQKINVQTGVISTSSGRMIHYGPKDS